MGPMVDWTLATTPRRHVAGEPPSHRAARQRPRRRCRGQRARVRRVHAPASRRAAAAARGASAARRGSTPTCPAPRDLLEPLSAKLRDGTAGMGPLAGPVATAAGYVLAAEVGVLFGFLSQRVLGQYELVLLDPTTPPRLLFVAPNLDEAARQARRRPPRVPALGRPARGHARAPVRGRAVAARAPGRPGARADRRLDVSVDPGALRLPVARRPARRWSTRCARATCSRLVTSPEQRAIARPHPGDDGGPRGPRRARHGRGRRRRAALAAASCAPRWSAAATPASAPARLLGGCSAWR